jgi:hypothetical protein
LIVILELQMFTSLIKKETFEGAKDKDEYKEGYNAASPSDLYNEMTDDVKVILAEYRLALKRNNAKDRQN